AAFPDPSDLAVGSPAGQRFRLAQRDGRRGGRLGGGAGFREQQRAARHVGALCCHLSPVHGHGRLSREGWALGRRRTIRAATWTTAPWESTRRAATRRHPQGGRAFVRAGDPEGPARPTHSSKAANQAPGKRRVGSASSLEQGGRDTPTFRGCGSITLVGRETS